MEIFQNHGEVTLANLGVLFLDEFSEFKSYILDALRIPLEERKITISRVNAKLTYPTNFILIAAMNPCPCGYYGSDFKECICSEKTRLKYLEKISGPLMDRFDLFTYLEQLRYNELNKKERSDNSQKIKERVIKARNLQYKRYEKYGIYTNSELDNKLIEKFCKIDKKSEQMLEKYYKTFKISTRSYNKIIKVARTIADLDLKQNIELNHIAEALQYRNKEERI